MSMDNELFGALRETTKKWANGELKENVVKEESSTSSYAPAGKADDLHGAVAKLVHEWDNFKLDKTFPDNVHAHLKNAIGAINPGNSGAEADTSKEQSKDDSQVDKDMSGDKQAVSDQSKFIPKDNTSESAVTEETLAGNVNPGNKGAAKETDKELAKDNDQVRKDMSAELKNDKEILQKTAVA